MSTSVNPRFGKYHLVMKLGMGGMAEVYKAEYRHDPNVVVAIKRCLPQFSQDRKLVGMLVTEARLGMGLKHTNIVPILDFGLVDGTYFIAMEYVRGKDLKSVMIRCKSRGVDLPVHMAIFIMIQVLNGLQYAHDRRDSFDKPLGIVHRDISPHNILISLWGDVKILDFGIAKASSIASSTQTGILKGKFSYMAPEQAMGKQVDARTDIFAAGIVLWELLTLESYYQAATDIELLHVVRAAKTRDPSSVSPKIPKRLAQIVLRALEKKSRKRYASAQDFARALEDYQSDTFGKVTEADLAAFIRSLFAISAKDLEAEKQGSHADIIAGGIERALAEDVAAHQTTGSRAGLLASVSNLADSAWKMTLALAVLITLIWVFTIYKPGDFLRRADRQVITWAEWFHKRYLLPDPSTARQIVVELPERSAPAYPLNYTQAAQSALEELPFETFESIRIRASELANNPKPNDVKPNTERPGTYFVSKDDFKLVYTVSEFPKLVTVLAIVRTK